MDKPTKEGWFRIWMLAILLVITGGLIMRYLPECRVANKAADALVIAGVLALGVDPLLKRALLAEASKGIFIHLLGFEHRPEVKEKIKEIVFETKLIRKYADFRCNVEEKDGGGFTITVEYDTEIVNPTHVPVEYKPWLDFDMAHNPEVLQMSLTSSDGKYSWNDVPKPKETEPGVIAFEGKKFLIAPETNGITYLTHVIFKIRTGLGYEQFHFGKPTLKATLRVALPEGYEASMSPPATSTNENFWQFDTIQMPGDHVTLRWRRRGGAWI